MICGRHVLKICWFRAAAGVDADLEASFAVARRLASGAGLNQAAEDEDDGAIDYDDEDGMDYDDSEDDDEAAVSSSHLSLRSSQRGSPQFITCLSAAACLSAVRLRDLPLRVFYW